VRYQISGRDDIGRKLGIVFNQGETDIMALIATSEFDSSAAVPLQTCEKRRRATSRWARPPAVAVLAAALLLPICAATTSRADEATVRAAAAASERDVTIVLRVPIQRIEGDRVALQSMLRFSGRAWADARIEILANGVVVSRTTAMRGGLWYAPRTSVAAGDYEFIARAISPDGTREVSDVLRVTVSPPILVDPESLAGKSVYWVG